MQFITPQKTNFAKWYEDVIFHSDLASPGLVKGTIFIHPKTCYIWEQIQKFVNQKFKEQKIKNVLFPALIPLAELEKEKENLSGFLPELFLIKDSNNTNKEHSIFLRPTSEILFSHFFRRNLESYEDLPILLNQWSSVYRSEKNTKAFLRNCEFYWQEAHTIHETKENALEYLNIFHNIYKDLILNLLNIHVLSGEKTINERFVGADKTLTSEAIMLDGQVLQMATSHYLGKNFTTTFDIKYTSKDNIKEHPHQLSAGCSTRLIGAIIMSHSDDKGLVLPWYLSETKVFILVLNKVISKEDETYKQIEEQLNDIEHEWCFSNKPFGHRMNAVEKNGIPLTMIIGEKELSNNSVVIKTRISDTKELIAINTLKDTIEQLKTNYQIVLKEKSKKNLENSIQRATTLEEAIEITKDKKVVLVPWFNDENNEINFKSKGYNFTPRCIAEMINDDCTECFFSQKPANCWAYFGRSY